MNPYVLVAKLTVEKYIETGEIIKPPEDLSKEFFEKAGVFVTIEKGGQLRGCIGTYLPTKENIAEEIISNAIAAATEDYRFTPIKKEDLSNLSYIVYILDKPEFIKDITELDHKKYGIIVKTLPIISAQKTDVIFNGHLPSKTGLLLPDLDGVDTVEQQLSIACQKGGINPKNENILIYRFGVKKYD